MCKNSTFLSFMLVNLKIIPILRVISKDYGHDGRQV